jgi:outer membrane protein assembly factor BamE (lipoprotein component of BamABCDE complex)
MIQKIGQAVLVVLLAGCVSTGNSNLADDRTMEQIQVGKTTKQQVTSLLGDPASQRSIEMGGWTREWWGYSYASATINPLDYLLLYGFFYNGLGLYDTQYDLGVYFDHRGIVSSLSTLKTDYDMGGPLTSPRVSTVAGTLMGFPETAREPVRFEIKMESRY